MQRLQNDYAAFFDSLSVIQRSIFTIFYKRSLAIYGPFWRHISLEYLKIRPVHLCFENNFQNLIHELHQINNSLTITYKSRIFRYSYYNYCNINIEHNNEFILQLRVCNTKLPDGADILCNCIGCLLQPNLLNNFNEHIFKVIEYGPSDTLEFDWTLIENENLLQKILQNIDNKKIIVTDGFFYKTFEDIVGLNDLYSPNTNSYNIVDEMIDLVHTWGYQLDMSEPEMDVQLLFILSKEIVHSHEPEKIKKIFFPALQQIITIHQNTDGDGFIEMPDDIYDLPGFKYLVRHFPIDVGQIINMTQPKPKYIKYIIRLAEHNYDILPFLKIYLKQFPSKFFKHVCDLKTAQWIVSNLEECNIRPSNTSYCQNLAKTLAIGGDFDAIEQLYSLKFLINLQECGVYGANPNWIGGTDSISIDSMILSPHSRPILPAFLKFDLTLHWVDKEDIMAFALSHNRLDVFNYLYEKGIRISFRNVPINWAKLEDFENLNYIYHRQIFADDFDVVANYDTKPKTTKAMIELYQKCVTENHFNKMNENDQLTMLGNIEDTEPRLIYLFKNICDSDLYWAKLEESGYRKRYIADFIIQQEPFPPEIKNIIRSFWWGVK